MKYLIIFFGIALISLSCSQKNSENDGSNLPQSRAGESEVLIVMDSTKWGGELGKVIRNTFSSNIPGLPQPEPYFALKHVKPAGFKSILRQASNLIIVMTLDNKSREGELLRNYFTGESLEKIRSNDDIFMFTQENVFARGQNVLYLYGQNDQNLINHIQENQESLKQFFLKNEKTRISRKIYSGRGEVDIEKKLVRDHGFFMDIPANYELAKEDDSFVWIRQLGADDKSIVVYYEDYKSEKSFEEEGIRDLRQKMATEHLVDIEKPSLYMMTEDLIPLHMERINLNGKYAVEVRGLWKLSDHTRGGPFLSYVFVDENLNRIYYLEGFLANPGRNKREPMRELEIILNSFKTKSEMGQQS